MSVTAGDLSIDLSAYETSANAAATYYPLTNPASYIDASALTGYATESWVTSQGYLTSAPVTSVAGKTGDVSLVVGDVSGAAPLASPALTGNVTITTNSTSPALFVTQTGTGNILTLHDQASDTTFVAIDQNGKVNTIASASTNAGFNVPHGAAPSLPVNGDIWTTTSGLFMRQNGATQQYVDLAGSQTINGTKTFSAASIILGNATSSGTINVGTGATVSGATKAVNIGTNGAAGSTTNITIGSTTGTSTTTLQGITNGVTQSAGDSSLKLATTAFVTTADNLKANLASPTFTGTPAAPTATPGTNTTQIATTAFVTAAVSASTGATWGSITGTLSSQTDLQSALDAKLSTATAASTYAPLASPTFTGTVTIPAGASISGYATTASLSSYAPLASPALTGTPTAPTATAGTNTTQIATTAFVTAAIPTNNVKAWVNFNGTGTVSIRGSMNVSSITDNGTGNYTVNFTTALADANYAAAGFAAESAFSVGITVGNFGTLTQTTTAFRFNTTYGTTSYDCTQVHMTIHR
jgi:hypothetical protein